MGVTTEAADWIRGETHRCWRRLERGKGENAEMERHQTVTTKARQHILPNL